MNTKLFFQHTKECYIYRALILKQTLDALAYISLGADFCFWLGFKIALGLPATIPVNLGFVTGALQMHADVLNLWGNKILNWELPTFFIIGGALLGDKILNKLILKRRKP